MNRYNQFVSNLDTIAAIQDYHGDSASFGINKFADMNGEEWYFTMLGYYNREEGGKNRNLKDEGRTLQVE